MREIKFRAWDGEFYIAHEHLEEINVEELCKGVINDCPTEGEQTRITVEQYTGLKDKNGKEIYEGDIVADSRGLKNYLVQFREDRGGFYPYASGDGCGCCESDCLSNKQGEIIGNVHENKDLL